MRILAIRGKNLASLAAPFDISLTTGALAHAGLFAITGQTGAGKSTILDALCLALYDQIPRLPSGQGFAIGHKDDDDKLRVTSNDVRSILRRGTSHAYAEVDFIGKDKQPYRARWEVSKARGKVDGRLQAQEMTLSHITSGQRIGQGKKNTLDAISELIDLSFDQFRRSVLLAQGDFAAFLKAKKDERSSLLERITGTELYSQVSMAAFDRAKVEKDALKRLNEQLHGQLPLDSAARSAVEQRRDDCIAQLTQLDQAIADQQNIIQWHSTLKQHQQAEQQAQYELTQRQQAWAATAEARQFIDKVAAAHPLKPLLTHYQTALTDSEDAQQQCQISADVERAAHSQLVNATTQFNSCTAALVHAEQQHQHAQPLLIAVRALDTRLELAQHSVKTLTTETRTLADTLTHAQQHQRTLLTQHAEHSATLAQLNNWLANNQALQAIAAEWQRWAAELARYQTLHDRKHDTRRSIEQLTQTLAQDEPNLAALSQALNDNNQQLAQYQATLADLKRAEQQQPLETVLQAKDAQQRQRDLLSAALHLATTADALQQSSQQHSEQLASTEQALVDNTAQLHALNQQHTGNSIALDEAKKALALLEASSHKNAQQFRALLRPDQPCPVCGALAHPWQHQTNIGNSVAVAQSARVAELEQQHEQLIKTLAEVKQTSAQLQRQKITLTEQLTQAQLKLAQCHDDWAALTGANALELALTDPHLRPQLNQRIEDNAATLATLQQQERAALALQKQLKTAQDLFDATQRTKEHLSANRAALEQQHTDNTAALNQLKVTAEELTEQLAHILTILALPFQRVANWQQQLHESITAFTQHYAASVQQFHDTEHAIARTELSLTQLNQAQQLAAQALAHSQQQRLAKQTALTQHTNELHALNRDRAALLPITVSATAYEQGLQQQLSAAKTAQQHAADTVKHAETAHANATQQQQHWQNEMVRRNTQLHTAQQALNAALAQHAISYEQLSELLTKDADWLQQQKTAMTALERRVQESAALVTIKTQARQQHESQTVASSEHHASAVLDQLQAQRQALQSHKEEQLILIREDDKKIAAGQLLMAELNRQQQRWEQWESLNDLIGSANGSKFRIFAQSLTLEALLTYSNQHLADFAKRYVLQRVPNSDLELQIIDRDMADDVRSVHSLSGGESFLVSLALALGLASLSSNKTQVESLFIDEGFGSLDPETLDVAIASLDTLHALGRKVGVISHVPILVERIGAKVVVEKLGGGCSRVVILGN